MNARRITLAISLAVTAAMAGATAPAPAGAFATIAPPPNRSVATTLPDGRVYEQVSPADKHGFSAGGVGFRQGEAENLGYSIAVADGNTVSYGSDGPAAEVDPSGIAYVFVAQHTTGGWRSRSAMPRGLDLNKTTGLARQEPKWLYFSSDLSHLVFDIRGSDVPSAPAEGSEANLYLGGPDPFVEPVWLARPVGEEIKLPEEDGSHVSVLGGSPDLSTVYFDYQGSLISGVHVENWGLYEYHDGVLSYAGVLPDGSDSPNAPSIAIAVYENGGGGFYSPAATGNQVSQDGSRVFFISSEPEQLYVHETEADGTQRTVLASQSQLAGHVGEPAPSGVGQLAVTPPGPNNLETGPLRFRERGQFRPLLGYASPDGSHVFFRSVDRLTGEAPEGGGTYDFDVDTDVLEYVAAPGLAGIVTVADDGSSFVFENNAESPVELDRWSAGPHGGSVSKIVQLPGEDRCDGVSCVGPAHLVDSNSVLVFSAEAPIAGFNDAGEFMQIFRYDFKSNELSCVSCPPAGITPSGTAEISPSDETKNQNNAGGFYERVAADNRGVSSDGSRVFFDSPDPLVPRDLNGSRDVYEWENGTVFLISSGTSLNPSFFLDSSESGGDVFFTTSDGLVLSDNDAQYDVYDARIPRPGDNPPPAQVPCQGDVCQGPPSVPSLLGPPASATFNGLGNVTPEPVTKTPVVSPTSRTSKTRAKGCEKGHVKKRNNCMKKPKAKKAGHRRRVKA